MSRAFKRVIILIALIVISFLISDSLRKVAVDFSVSVVGFYDETKMSIGEFITEHFNQQDEIIALREENKRLSEEATLSIAFAGKLNDFLKEAELKSYDPQARLVRALSYVNLGDYNRIWIDFPEFDSSKIYGLLYQGYSAGIVVDNIGRPQAILQNDPKSSFSVYIGDSKIRGIAFGIKDHLEIRYIPLWTRPSVGDEVTTSGLDEIFFEGVGVGKVTDVIEEEGFFTAVVEPYANVEIPGFFHVIVRN